MLPETSPFSEDYQTARARFCDAAAKDRWKILSYSRTGGREGELFTDFARIGAEQPKKLLVMSSGLHGVEGFLGSAIQLQFLQELDVSQLRDSDSAILLIHALNPFGFARVRRFDENNVDVNRNFLFPDDEYRGAHPLYKKLGNLLNPKEWPRWELPPHIQALMKVVPYGFYNLQEAIAQGQYDFPLGLFYGGNEPSPTMRFIESEMVPQLQAAEHVLHLDIHSGLGKRGQSQLLFDYEISESDRRQLEGIFGEEVKLSNVGAHYEAKGSFYNWLRHHVPQAATFCWEFGTCDPITVLSALRAENAACQWGDRGSKSFEKSKEKLKEAFCPKSHKWRANILSHTSSQLKAVIEQWL